MKKMKTKKIEEKEIIKKLDDNHKIWYLKEKPEKNSSYQSLFDFLFKNKKKFTEILENEKIKPKDLAYNRSISHLLLYYSYNPKFPFVIIIDNTIKKQNITCITVLFLITLNSLFEVN